MAEDDRVYLDYNATTPLEGAVLTAIHEALHEAWANPASGHPAGAAARDVIVEARRQVSAMIGAKPEEIVFTSGGTEANNQILQTALHHFRSWQQSCAQNGSHDNTEGPRTSIRPHIVTSRLEHDSVRLVLEHFRDEGLADVTFVEADPRSGRVEATDALAAVTDATCLVTIMLANNETGIIQPVTEIGKRLRSLNDGRPGPRVLLHTDAAQALGKIPVDVGDLGIDYLTVVGHKFYGPRIGAIYTRGLDNMTNPLHPLFYGGGQERNFRPGTENTGMVAGLSKASELVVKCISKYERQMEEVRNYLENQLLETFGSERVRFNGKIPDVSRLPNTCNVSILSDNFTGADVLGRCRVLLASVGAACHSGNSHGPSPVLLASGVSAEAAHCALRLSVGRHTTRDQVDLAVRDLKQAVDSLSSTS